MEQHLNAALDLLVGTVHFEHLPAETKDYYAQRQADLAHRKRTALEKLTDEERRLFCLPHPDTLP